MHTSYSHNEGHPNADGLLFYSKGEFEMRTLVRSTSTTDEYWCTKEKRVISLPKGTIPDFEVMKEPETMLGDGTKTKVHDKQQDGQTFIDDMNVKELRAYAKENNITIPFEVKKLEDIRKFIIEYLDNPDGEQGDEN